ncbi:hypothetical protein [Streptomyces sp. NRRL S-146]|uniref:hypothetical protein n=1 Tax=Streptomyces sp. NRRL S-146 TaxID=1463884 RepID=UPI00131DDBE7|nr:hypothetical protein [Streptomyces sp. NRRL S-146]
MASSQWTIGSVLARWKLALVPVGFSIILYGNDLYGSPHQRLGRVLFIAGWVITVSGMPTWKRFVDEDPLRAGYERYAWVVLFLILFLAGPAHVVFKVIVGAAHAGDYRTAATSLGLIYLMLPLIVRWAEPKDYTFARLPSRIGRATLFRTVANAAGIGAVGAFLGARFTATYPAPLISTVLTLMVTMVVVTHKTFARARKLCTQTCVDVQALLWAMDELDDAKRWDKPAKGLTGWRRWRCSRNGTDVKHADKQMAARQSWDALKLDLCTTVDSGYRLFGLPLLTRDEVDELERKLLVEIKAADPTAAASARKNLHAIQKACAGRIDVLA